MTTLPDRMTFESAYAGQAPWDIGRPQKALIDVADWITGSVLDAGCGTGENALFFASRGHKVTGIDFLEEPITRARRKATERGLSSDNYFSRSATIKIPDRPRTEQGANDNYFSRSDRQSGLPRGTVSGYALLAG